MKKEPDVVINLTPAPPDEREDDVEEGWLDPRVNGGRLLDVSRTHTRSRFIILVVVVVLFASTSAFQCLLFSVHVLNSVHT